MQNEVDKQNKIEVQIDRLAQEYRLHTLDDCGLAAAVFKLRKSDKKKAHVLALAKWKVLSELSDVEITLFEQEMNYTHTDLCGLCALYESIPDCVDCPIFSKTCTKSGCCPTFEKYWCEPSKKAAKGMYNKIRKAYKRIYGE